MIYLSFIVEFDNFPAARSRIESDHLS